MAWPDWLATGQWSRQACPWLADHAVLGTVVVPGTAFTELAASVAAQAGWRDVIEELTLEAPLILPADDAAVLVQLWVGEQDDRGRRPMTVHSRAAGNAVRAGGPTEAGRPPGADGWTRHVTGVLATAQAPAPAPTARGRRRAPQP